MKKTVLFLSLLFINGLEAQTLSLNACIQKAFKSHPDIKKSLLQIKHSKYGVDAAKADYRPQLSLDAEYNPRKTYVLPANGAFTTIEDDGWQVGMKVKKRILDFSKTSSNIEAQKIQGEITNLSLHDVKALLAYKVKLQYELLVVQREAIGVRKKDLKAKEELYKQAKALRKQGLKTKADESRFLSSLYLAKDNLALSLANFEKAKMLLSLYIGIPIHSKVKLQNNISKSNWKRKDIKYILKHSPTLKSLRKNIDKKEFSYKSAKASHYGTVDAVASYTRQNSLNKYDSSYVGITLSIPLYSGGKTTALEEQAQVDKRSAKYEYDSKVLAIREEVQGLLIDLRHYERSIGTQRVQHKANEETKKVIASRYKGGLSTYIELLDAITVTQESELSILEAKYQKSSIVHRLEYLEGKTK